VRLVGIDALSWKDRLTLEVARSIREDYLHQNAFDDIDTYTSIEKQYRMLRLVLMYQDKGQAALDQGANLSQVIDIPAREKIGRSKLIAEDSLQEFDAIESDMNEQLSRLIEGGETHA